VPSGTRSSSYRGPKPKVTFWRSNSFRARNFTNLESFGFFLTDRSFFADVGARGFANRIHKRGTAIRDKGPFLRAFRSAGPRRTHFNFQTRSVRELGTFRSQYANQEPTRLRQPIAKTRILTFADSRNLAHRQPRGITDRQSFAPNVTTAALLNRNTSGKTTHTPQLKALRLDNPSLQKASRHE
jgi:hypothetical protein